MQQDCHNGDVQASQKHTSNIFNFPSQDGHAFLLQALTMVASSAASARSWTLMSRLFPGRRSMPRRRGQVMRSFVEWKKNNRINRPLCLSLFSFLWDIFFQGESRGRRKDCFEKGSQVQFCIEMSNLQNCVEIIAFEMSLNDELLLKYRHVNLRSLQLGPSTMLKVHRTDIISPPYESM